MIVWQLIDKVRIYRNYKIQIDLKMGFEQFEVLWRRHEKNVTVDTVA